MAGRRRAASGRAALDKDLESVLSGGADGDIFGASPQRQIKGNDSSGRPSTRSGPGKKVKTGSLTSGSTDEDFYSSLAKMAGDSFDDDDDDKDESISEADAKKMAASLADLDDLESDLLGSLGKKTTPSKPPKSASKTAQVSKTATASAAKPRQEAAKEEVSRPSSVSPDHSPRKASFSSSLSKSELSGKTDTKKESSGEAKSTKPKKKFDFGEFDEDDPLAGLLSDDDDDIDPKPKPKKASTPKKASSAAVTSQDPTEDRPKSSRGRQPTSQSPPVTPEHKVGARGDTDVDERATSPPTSGRQRPSLSLSRDDSLTSPPGSPEAKPESRGGDARSPLSNPQSRQAGKSAAQRAKPAKEEINFDSDEDLPGLDDSLEKTPRDSPSPPPTKSPAKSSRQAPAADLFGEDDNLLDTRSESPTRKSRFDELLGKKEKDESKKQVPKSLDDFMANIGGGKSDAARNTATTKKVSSPTSEDSFQFGGYMPSAASSGQSRGRGGLARPDTAPGSSKRSVRFADDLGLGDDDLFTSERPSTAPSERGRRKQVKDGDDEDTFSGSGLDNRKKNSPGLPRKETNTQAAPKEIKPVPKEVSQPARPKEDKLPGSKPSGGAGDWLGLGGDDNVGGLEVNSTPSSTAAPKESKETTGLQGPPDRQERQASPPRRSGRYRGGNDDNEFLRMLGITPEEPSATKQTETSHETTKSSQLPWESPGGSPRRGRRWRSQAADQGGPLDEQQEGALDKEHQASGHGDPPDQPVTSERQDLTTPAVEQQQTPSSQEKPKSLQPVVTPQSHPPPPESTHPLPPAHPQQLPPQQTYATRPIPPQAYIPQQISAQPYTPQSYPQPQSSAQFQQPAGQYPPQTPLHQIQYQSPVLLPSGFQPSPQALQQPSLERLEVTKLKAENELQGSRLVEYEVANEHHSNQKTRLEEEVKELVMRVQEMDSSRHKKDLDAASRVAELEGKVRRLELEQEQLLSTIEALKTRHKNELANIDTSHKSHLKTLEESYHRREQRLKEETDLIITQNNEKFKNLEAEKADLEASTHRKITILETAKNGEIDRLKDLHRRAIDQFRQEHEEEMQHLRKLKDQEVSAATSAHAHTKSLQSLMDQVLSSTREVSDLRHKVEVTHKSGLDERELSARARDEYLKQLQERLLRQQSENDDERARLQGLVAKMELHMREQTRQVDQERWRLSQEESRLKALQAALEDERRLTMEQLSSQRAEVQRGRDDLVREQRTTMSSIQEERRTLATERAQLSSAHRDMISREKLKTETSVQAEADLGATAVKIKEDAAAMNVREAQVKQEEERLRREKHEFERQRGGFDEEKDRIGKLGLEVQKRSREIEELCSDAARVRDEGEQSLELAERVRVNAEAQRAEAEGALLVVQEKERQLAQDRLAIAHERRLLEKDKQTGRCWQCEGRRTGPTTTPTVEQFHTADSPAVDASLLTLPSLSLSTPGTPDLLVNSLEFKRSLRKWTHDKEKDEEFLEQEAQFLDRLQRTRDTNRQKPSTPLNSAAY